MREITIGTLLVSHEILGGGLRYLVLYTVLPVETKVKYIPDSKE